MRHFASAAERDYFREQHDETLYEERRIQRVRSDPDGYDEDFDLFLHAGREVQRYREVRRRCNRFLRLTGTRQKEVANAHREMLYYQREMDELLPADPQKAQIWRETLSDLYTGVFGPPEPPDQDDHEPYDLSE